MAKGLHILITGGASGLGREIAEALIAEGHRVWCWGRKANASLPENAAGYQSVDLADVTKLDAAFRETLAVADHIDVLINNASLRDFKNFADYSAEEISAYINVNQQSPVLLSAMALEQMKTKGFGRIINISSGSGLKGYSSGSLYCSTKAAINSFTEAAGRDMEGLSGKDITVNAVLPGAFSKNDGTKLASYDQTVKAIIAACKGFIQGKESGSTVLLMQRKEKMQYLMGSVKKFLR